MHAGALTPHQAGQRAHRGRAARSPGFAAWQQQQARARALLPLRLRVEQAIERGLALIVLQRAEWQLLRDALASSDPSPPC